MTDETLNDRLDELRDDIAEVDRSLLELLRRRMELAAEIGRVKARAGRPIVVPEVYDRVLTRARQHAEACGVSAEVMTSIFDAVIRGSVERQHRIGVASQVDVGERLLILGGAGNMGGWFASFARLLGHIVDLVDPALGSLPPQAGRFGSLEAVEDLDRYAAIIVSVPLAATGDVLAEIIARKPRGLVIEIASVKDQLEPVLATAEQAGVRVACLHPMFGPSKSPYESLTFVLACRDDPQDEKERIEQWLRHPYTNLVPVPFPHHDRLMGWLLGLAHLMGMLFGTALGRSGLSGAELAACASTTFNRQAATARSVLSEDPDLYFEIQRLNPHRGRVYAAAREALDALVDAVDGDDRARFRELLASTRDVFGHKG
ncbi:MAG: prephenate dehydrogenase/arogenate dehydrogenase family protein [Acidobacteriota bacterium]